MWLKPITGTINAVFANIVTFKEAFRNSAGFGAGANFDLGDLMFGYQEAVKLFLGDGMFESKFRQNKAYLLMEKFGYLPDSYDWYTRPNQLLTAKNKLFSTRSLMLFHTLPEEILATAIFIAQLRAMEYTTEAGTKSNVWEGYKMKKVNVGDRDVFDVVWDGGSRGTINTSNLADQPVYEELQGLSTNEINHIKFLYEKIHGGYRTDERAALEYHVFGEMIIQLKKYFPMILKNV